MERTDFKPVSRRVRLEDPKDCPVEATLRRVGGKWKGLIVLRLLVRKRRFNELLRSLPGCTQRMLTNQLRELEADGIVVRQSFGEVPPRVEYSLSVAGQDLEPVVRMMCAWGQKHVQGVEPNWESALANSG